MQEVVLFLGRVFTQGGGGWKAYGGFPVTYVFFATTAEHQTQTNPSEYHSLFIVHLNVSIVRKQFCYTSKYTHVDIAKSLIKIEGLPFHLPHV